MVFSAMVRVVLTVILIGAFLVFVKFSALSHADHCSDLADRAHEALAAARECTTTEDCMVYEARCPFQCLNAVAKNSLTPVLHAIDAYQDQCLFNCVDCPKEQALVTCVEQRCTLRSPSL